MATSPDRGPLILRSRIPATAHGQLLLDYVSARFPYHDRERWQREILAGTVTLDDLPATPQQPLRAGASLAYTKDHREPFVDDRVPIVHLDDSLVVVDKPAHLPMHADGPFVRSTLVHLLRERLADPELSLVHRLDRETSGVCVIARTPAARASLHAQFAAGTVHKVYLALVRGQVVADFVVDAPIGRSRHSHIALRRAAGEHASAPQPAYTAFTVVERGATTTLLRCEPRTGRTHQIRVHLEHAGFPIVGDRLYGRSDDDFLAFVRAVKQTGDPRLLAGPGPDRQLLHASALRLGHPETGAETTFTAPMPALFTTWLLAPPTR